jgi:hypothetical protein
MGIEEEKKEEIKKLKAMAIDKMNSTIDHLNAIIILCETDKGDDRYDILHDVKNRVTTARKRIKRIGYMDDEGGIIQEG